MQIITDSLPKTSRFNEYLISVSDIVQVWFGNAPLVSSRQLRFFRLPLDCCILSRTFQIISNRCPIFRNGTRYRLKASIIPLSFSLNTLPFRILQNSNRIDFEKSGITTRNSRCSYRKWHFSNMHRHNNRTKKEEHLFH